VLDRHQQFADLRNHWGWDFLFALIYAMFLDRWMKVALLEDATPLRGDRQSASIDHLVRFLVFAACFLLLAMIMSMLRLEGISETLIGWHLPLSVAGILGTTLFLAAASLLLDDAVRADRAHAAVAVGRRADVGERGLDTRPAGARATLQADLWG